MPKKVAKRSTKRFAENIPQVLPTRKEAVVECKQIIRRMMTDCQGTEYQRLKVFQTMLIRELAQIDERIEELRPDDWGT